METRSPLLRTQLVAAADAETLSGIAATVFRDAYRSALESDRQVEEFLAATREVLSAGHKPFRLMAFQ